MTEKSLRRSDDERFPEVALHLSPHHVEVLSRGGGEGDVDIGVSVWFRGIVLVAIA